ncbi:retention module-containing protein [Aeromonas veronii]|uniref:retention module-containing protein n=1 Tax=Aeromonas veronii TaxID=654 RepID=UPI001F21B809|nr:retention module-containing protein [Aeromonas veronii]
MAELQIEKSTVITQLEGSVFVISADGSVIRAKVGMALQPGDRLQSVQGSSFQLAEPGSDPAGEQETAAKPEPVTPAADGQPADPELASLQEAIRQGIDPTELFQETAAGIAAPAAGNIGGVSGSSSGGFVVVDRTNDATLAEAGFDTDYAVQPVGDELLFSEERDFFAAITITEPQTSDNIINADEAVDVIIRGVVDDVEVGQPVTVTLIDQAGNSLTVTTVVLPGLVWEANFGDVTGKLVDGPLQIVANTQDQAGNNANDTGQTLLDTITTITLDLADESDTGASQTDDLTRDNTPLLQGKGEPGATVTLSLGGNVLTVLTVDAAGNWQYQLPQTLADGQYQFQVNSVDIAGNRASDTLVINVDTQASIDIDDLDSTALFGNISATLSGSTSNVEAGQSVTITLVDSNGQPLLTTSAQVGADGRWQVSGLDLSGINQSFEVRASVTDLAGNSALDGAPLIGQSETLTLSETGLANGPVTATGSLNTGAGVDGNLQVTFAADQSALEGLGLVSQGVPLGYSINGQTLTASAGGATVFTLTLNNDGSYRIVWSQSLDHSQNTLRLPFNLEYRDSDGDLVKAPLVINLVDSNPPSFNFDLPPITLTEDAFTNSAAVVGESNFVVKHGVDPLLVDSLVFSNQSDTLATLNGSGLASDGHPLTFEFADDRTLVGYYMDGSGQRVEVLRAELNAQQQGSDLAGRVVVTLTGPLDHQGSDSLSLGLQVSAKEIDGDSTSADLTLIINDGSDPALDIDKGVELQEGGNQSIDGQLPVTVGSDRLVSLNFEASQPALAGLTSQGKATSYEVQDNQLIVKDWQGKPILTVTIGLDGKYSVSLTGVFDEPEATNSLNLGLKVQGSDFDGDKSNLGTLNITITDGALPQVNPVSLTLTEDSNWQQGQTLDGDLTITAGSDPLASITFDANQPGLQGFTSGKQAVTIAVADHLIEGRTPDGKLVFELTLGNDGKYSFTLHQPLDQGSADSLLKAGFTLLDSDGDKVSSTITVAVGDGANPTISAVTGTTITEMAQGETAAVSTMSFSVAHGSDALDPNSLGFDIAAIQSTLTGLTSHGNPVTFAVDPATGQLVGTAGGQVVLRAELSLVDNNGNWSVTAKVTLSGELDHKGSESLNLPLAVTLADKDGDRIGTTLPLTIADGKAPSFIPGKGVSLDEGDLTGSNSLSQTGHFDVQAGSDRVVEVAFADASEQPALTALGKPVQYELVDGNSAIPSSQLIKGYVIVDGQRVEVFEVKLVGSLDQAGKNGFDYQVTLYQGLHQGGNAVTELPIKVIVNDYDKAGGNNDSTSGTLNIQIGEGEKPTLTLTDVTLNEGRFDGANSAVDDQQASGKITIKADSDPVTDVRLTLSGQVMDASGKPITHNGETLIWKAVGTDGHTFQAVASGGLVVMTVSIPTVPASIAAHTSAEIGYQVTVHTNLDHGADNKLELTLPVEVTDSDGSKNQGTATITVSDSADPVLGLDKGVALQEGGNQSIDGQLPVMVGSDRLVSLNFEASQPALAGLTSQGKATSYEVQDNQLIVKDWQGKPILTVTIGLDGKYSVSLTGVFDEPEATNSLNLGLKVQGSDFDGDKSNLGTLNITITDGALPQVNPVSLTLTEDSNWQQGQTLDGDLTITAGSDPLASITFDANQPGLQGFTSGKQAVTIAVADHLIEGRTPDGKLVFELTLGNDGKYSFTLHQPLDQGSADSLLKAGFTLLDSDGDKVSSTITVAVGDGANPTISAVTGTTITEMAQGETAAVSTMSFSVAHGSDALDPASLGFDIAAIQSSLTGLTSHGDPITFSLDANGQLVGTAGGQVVLRAELSLVDNNGNWSVTANVTLSGELDHKGSESLNLPLAVTLADKDGDRIGTTLPLTIVDGKAPSFIPGKGVSLDEGDLTGSNSLSQTGHFDVQAGSDRVIEVAFADASEQPALTALGKPVQYELVDGDPLIPGSQLLKGYVMVDGQRVEVFEVKLIGSLDQAGKNGFDYQVTLYQGLHQGGNAVTELPIKVIVNDYDKAGGNNDSTSGTLNIQIGEGEKPTLTLTDVTLNEGRFDGANSAVDDQQASGKITIKADSDPVTDVRLTLSGQVMDASGKPITHNGETLIWKAVGTDGHTFQAVASGGLVVMTVSIPTVPASIAAHTSAEIGYQVTVHTNLDHGADNKLELTLPVEVTDSDGSKNQGTATITVSDSADPVLGLDKGVALQEGGNQSIDGQLPVMVGSDRLVSLNFEASQPALAGLTSQGKATSYEVQDNQLIVKDWQGKTILTVTIGLDGKYSVSLTGVFDEPEATNSLNLGLKVQGTDFDDDKSNLGTLNITITDGALPQVNPVSLTLTEDSNWQQEQTLDGDLTITAGSDPLASITFDANQPGLQGFTSGKQAVTITVADHLIEGRTPDGTLVFKLTLGNDGKYSFTLHQPLDQGSADSLLKAGFTLLDSDGDKVSSNITVAVGDGANPTISAVTGTTITEMAQGETAAVSTMSFSVAHGSDALDPNSLGFDIAAIQSTLTGLTSHGNPVTFAVDPATGQLVGTAGGQVVLRAELSLVDNNGNWSVTAKVTLSGELDHKGSESLNLPLAVTLADKDGDRIGTTLPLTIVDGKAPSFIPGTGVTLDEGNLTGSNSLSQTGHFDVQAGSDRVVEVAFADGSQQPALTALGQTVKYELLDGDPAIPGSQLLKGYVMVDGQRVEVFEVRLVGTLDQAGKNGFDYQVTLYQGIHQGANAVTELPIKVIVNDYDKASGNNDSTSGTLNIQIGEGEKPTLTLTDVTLNEGRFDGANSAVDDQQTSGKITIKADSDPVTDVRLTLSGQVMDASGKPITHNGETLTWKAVGTDGHTFQAVTSGGLVVMTVSIPTVPASIAAHTSATIDYQVTVYTNLDHGADDKLNLTLPVEVTDSDGSKNQGTATITVTDGINPIISAIEPVRVEESDLDAVNGQHPGTTPAESGETDSGKVTITAGSDRVASLELDVAAFNQANHLMSGGKAVTLAPHSTGWYLATAEGGKPVFWVHLDVNGSYSVHLVGQLDHGAQGNDELTIEVPLFVTDHDGDRSPNVSVTVTVQDDMPIGTVLAHTLSEGSSTVTGDLLPTANEGADGARVESISINGQTYAINGSLIQDVMSPDGKQVMGTLTISADGSYSFKPAAGFNHDASQLSQVVTAHLVDGDGDHADSTLTLNLQDEAVRFTVSAAIGNEDQGAQDPRLGIPINMQLDIGDFDRGEHVDQLLIQAPTNAHGTFYYNGVALTTTADGLWFIVPPAAMVTSDNVHYTTQGVTFVPSSNWSSWSNGGQPLHFQVQLQVGVTEGAAPAAVTGDLAVTVRGVADKPLWDTANTTRHYDTNEDSTGIKLDVKASLTDTDRSETLTYQIKLEAGKGTLMLNGAELKPNGSGIYTVSAGNINKVTVVPAKDFSGDIKLSVTPISTEKNPIAPGQGTAQGDKIELVINVNPVADDAKLTIRDIQGKEDTQLDLGSKISLAHLGDKLDGSEQMFVRISGLPAGATLLLGDVAVAQNAAGYYEIPFDRIGELKLQPPKNSNVDFDLTIKGVVKDTATLTDASGQTHTVVNEKETASQTLHVDLVGVVDRPDFILNGTEWAHEGIGKGYSITVAEDGQAQLNFKLVSGELAETPLDTSESLNLVLSGLPEGARVFDASGKELTLTFAGLDAHGKPTYQVDVSDLGNLVIQPPHNSTEDLDLIAKVVVTENDGDSKSFDVPLHIKVEPEIDATDYSKTSHGLEDQFVVLDWHPVLSDGAEKVTHLSLSGIEPGYEIWIRVGGVDTQLTVSSGTVDLSDTDLQSLLNGGQLLVKAPEDSDRDTTIQSHVTVTQHDVDSGAVAEKVIDGNLHVDIQAVVEPDGELQIDNPILFGFLDQPVDLVGAFSFDDRDPSSSERIDYLVISDLPPGFVVNGGISDGKGNWTVPAGNLGNYSLQAPDGFTGRVNFTVSARILDYSDDGDISAPVVREMPVSAIFIFANATDEKAAQIIFQPAAVVGVEDHVVDLGAQLKSQITIANQDSSHDEVSIVITGLPPGVTLQGLNYDFVNGEYLIKLPTSLSGLENLTLGLPTDYAGTLNLNVRVVNTDTTSGDTKLVEKQVTLSITPEVDINGGQDGQPELTLQVKDVNGQPSNQEDTEIHLDLSVKLADISPSVADGGLETVKAVTITVDPKFGYFLVGNQPLTTLVVNDVAALKDLVFVPNEHFSGKVPLDIQVDILDTATTGTAQASWNGHAEFEIKPVNDPAKLTVHSVTGSEDGTVNLAGFGATLIDNDGSEQIVALQIKGVPDGFTLSAPAVNNGGGVWQIPVGTDFSKLTLIPPADFSGTVELSLSAFTLDKGLTIPFETSGSFTVTVNPVGDAIIADIQDKASGTEGDVITLDLGLETRDTQPTGGSAGNVHENKPEQVRVTIEGVPDGAEIRLPNGVAGTVVDLGGGRWQVTTEGGKLGAVELVTNDANGALDLKITAQSLDNGALGPEVNGTIHVEVSPVNDAPINVMPTTPQVAQEDQPFVIHGLQVKDVDAGNSPIKITLSVEHGTLTLPAGSGVTVVGNGTGSLVLTGTLADLNALLSGGVTYQGNSDFYGNDALTMVTNDQGNTGSGGALSDTDVLPIEVQPVNDAPVNQLPGSMTVKEDGSLSLSSVSVKDVDAGSAPVSMVLRVEHGVLTLQGATGAVMVQGAGTSEITLVGSLADLNQLLASNLHYEPAKDFWGEDTLTVTTSDQGNTGTGGPLSDTDQVTITVTPEPDMPGLTVDQHAFHALQGAVIPLGINASVVNPATGELSIRISGLNGAQVQDEHGQSVGHADGNGDWLIPADHSVPLYFSGFGDGDHVLGISAESSVGGSTVSTPLETITVHGQGGHELVGSDQGDWLFGSSGDDRLLGGHGNDILTGGAGSDLFVWQHGDEGSQGQPAIDTITDFHPEQGDKIDLADMLQGVTGNGVDDLLKHLSASVTTGSNGLSDVNLSVSPAGDGQITQQITLKDVDLTSWNLPSTSSHDILQSMLEDQHSLIIQHP